ncbi:MAG: right-handed parallel beta-helix repeat-containing protein [Euryarchaeota archaeon]|nr:right-handed parallel beta-helix repeat-containing protein [Euryarchaeota archaeon]
MIRNIIVIWLCCLTLTSVFIFVGNNESTAIAPHNQIYINGNADFAIKAANEGWSGDGTQGNPYIIQGYNIQTNTSHGIHIESTTVYFIIRDTNVTMGSASHQYYGIYLKSVQNGIISNCSFTWVVTGIYLNLSTNINISKNYFTNNTYGIQLFSSSTNVIVDNDVSQSAYEGIWLNLSEKNNILNNEFYYNRGIKFDWSPHCIIRNNFLHDEWDLFVMFSNSDNATIEDNNFLNITVSIIWSTQSSRFSIQNNTIQNCGNIYLVFSNWTKICDNNMTESDGLELYGSSNNTISRNIFNTNRVGRNSGGWAIEFNGDSSDNVFNANNISRYPLGIRCFGINNKLHHNNMINNIDQVEVEQIDRNIWDDMHGQGNYWDNYTGSDIDGDGVGDTKLPHEGLDYYPLTSPVNIFTWTAPTTTVPSITRNLQATSGNTYVNLTWDSPIDNGGSAVTGYTIFRSATPGLKEMLTTIGNVTYYNDTTVLYGFTYYYKVGGVNSVGLGPISKEISVAFPPSEPVNVTASAGYEYVNLSWKPPLHTAGINVTAYEILRGTTPSGNKSRIFVVVNAQWYNDTGVVNNQTYYYQISAFGDSLGYGRLSEEVNATPRGVSGSSNVNDTDNDGIPDYWELHYFGILSYVANDDPDGDGYTNLQEYQAQTNPNDSANNPAGTGAETDQGFQNYWWVILVIVVIGSILCIMMYLSLRKPKTPKGIHEWKAPSEQSDSTTSGQPESQPLPQQSPPEQK